MCSIPKMADVDVADEIRLGSQLLIIHAFTQSREIACGGFEDAFNRILLMGSQSTDERSAWRHVKLDGCQPRTILSSVPLFLHEQMKPAKPPCRVAKFARIPARRTLETDKGQSALVADGVAHVGMVEESGIMRRRGGRHWPPLLSPSNQYR